jgi:hypothetical protein
VSHAACWRCKFPLPSYLSAQWRLPAGACGKDGWRRVRAGMWGMCGRDDLCVACVAGSGRLPAPTWGGETQRMPSRTCFPIQRSDSREFVADHSIKWNQAHVNHMIDMSGAVPPLAIARACRVSGAEPLSSITPARAAQFSRCQRFSRLCVLMNPILPNAWPIGTWPAFASSETLCTGASCLDPS